MSVSGDERIKQFATLGNHALLDPMPLHASLKEIEAEHDQARADAHFDRMSRPFSNDVLSDAWFAALGCL